MRALWSGATGADSQGSRLTLLRPRTLDEALAARADRPDALVVAGGTGVLPWLTEGLEPPALLDLSAVAGLRDVTRDGDVVVLGAGVTYTQVIEDLDGVLPGLAAAARTIAGRQVRNRATLAGALVLADPSGDTLAALVAARAEVELAGAAGARRVAVEDFVIAAGRCALGPGELVVALRVPVADGPTAYAKAGARNAMARAVCGVAVALHPARRTLTAGVVGAAAHPVVPHAAEELVARRWGALDDGAVTAFGALVAEAVDDPIADVRGSGAYRRHLAGVLAARALRRAWEDLP